MEEFGYINEEGYLVSKFLEPLEVKYRDDDGTIKSKILSISDQLQEMDDYWKPVDRIDDNLMIPDDPDYVIIPMPYDAGNRIAYRYEKQFDIQKVRSEIRELKGRLSEGDYKIVKCYEASLLGNPLPYDISKLHTERQAQRDRINELETKL